MTTATTIRLTGEITEWHPTKGWGLIRAEEHTFFAHAKEFMSDCVCGQRHKCEIGIGMTVTFSAIRMTPVYERGKLPAANEIRVKP
jgi:hypothetical protein